VIGVDEVCGARGRHYLPIMTGPRQEGRPTRVLLAVEGRDNAALRKLPCNAPFLDFLEPGVERAQRRLAGPRCDAGPDKFARHNAQQIRSP
jgi:hypothetical protein